MVATKHLLKIAVASAALGCVASANAWIFIGYGTDATVGVATTFTVNTVYTDLMAMPAKEFFGFNYTPVALSGSALLTNGPQSLFVDFAGTSVVNANTYSFAGTWTEVANVKLARVIPEGTFSGSLDNFDPATNLFTSGDFSLTFVGTVTPEPTPYAVVGVGVIGLLLRRKRTR